MGLRDRIFTPQTAKAIMSWRILLGVAVGAGSFLLGVPIVAAAAIGFGAYVASVAVAMPRAAAKANIDPFALGEPWRQIMKSADGAGRKLRDTVRGVRDGPVKQRLEGIVAQLEHGLIEAWEIAKAGDTIDDTVRKLEPTKLRSRLGVLRKQIDEGDANPELLSAMHSVERQIESADRLTKKSNDTAATLRLTQTQLDELVARAAEVKVGTVDTDAYAKDVDDLVVRLEALHQAVEETATA